MVIIKEKRPGHAALSVKEVSVTRSNVSAMVQGLRGHRVAGTRRFLQERSTSPACSLPYYRLRSTLFRSVSICLMLE